jgi:hypothetical protein
VSSSHWLPWSQYLQYPESQEPFSFFDFWNTSLFIVLLLGPLTVSLSLVIFLSFHLYDKWEKLSFICLFPFYFYSFGNTLNQTQGLQHVRQVLYHWATAFKDGLEFHLYANLISLSFAPYILLFTHFINIQFFCLLLIWKLPNHYHPHRLLDS